MFTERAPRLTHHGVLAMMASAVAKAEEIGQPQCIVIVDASGETLAQLRMTGAKFLSLRSARAKARTAASTGAPSAEIPESVAAAIAAATEGEITRLPGGFPVVVAGVVVGGVGVGSGSPDQDVAVGIAALEALASGADP